MLLNTLCLWIKCRSSTTGKLPTNVVVIVSITAFFLLLNPGKIFKEKTADRIAGLRHLLTLIVFLEALLKITLMTLCLEISGSNAHGVSLTLRSPPLGCSDASERMALIAPGLKCQRVKRKFEARHLD